jgi:hypothetical protein
MGPQPEARKEEIVNETRDRCWMQASGGHADLLGQLLNKPRACSDNGAKSGSPHAAQTRNCGNSSGRLCDEIFGLRAQIHEAASRSGRQQLQAAEARCDEFAKQLEQTDPEQADPDVLAAFRRDMQAFGSLPPESAGRLQKRQRELEVGLSSVAASGRPGAQQQAMDSAAPARPAAGELKLPDRPRPNVDDGLIAESAGTAPERPGTATTAHTVARRCTVHRALKQLAARADEQRHRLVLEAEILAGLVSRLMTSRHGWLCRSKSSTGSATGHAKGSHCRLTCSNSGGQPVPGVSTSALAERFYAACYSLLKAGRP